MNRFIPAFLAIAALAVVPAGAYAVTIPSLVDTETTANVSEVKATRTLAVGALPANAESITIGTCTVTFTTTAGSTVDDTNCSGGATVDTNLGAGNTNRTAAEIAAVLRSLTNVSDTGHGALTVTGATTNAIFTTTGTEAAATAITFTDGTSGDVSSSSSTTGVVPVAQVVTVTPSSVVRAEYSVTINSTEYTFDGTANSQTVQSVVEGLDAALASESAVDCTENNSVLTCTAASAGTAFTYDASVEGYITSQSRSGSGNGRTTARVVSDTSDEADDLMDQVEALQAMIAAIMGGAAPDAPALDAGASSFTRDLDMGSEGADVTALQNWLIGKGFAIEAGATGYFGAQTQAALAAYQAANGITPAVGYFGPLTRTSIK